MGIGIVRDPVPILRSLSNLVAETLCDKMGMHDIYGDVTQESPDRTHDVATWSGSMVSVLSDCFGSEADLYTTPDPFAPNKGQPHGYYTTFPAFKDDPVQA